MDDSFGHLCQRCQCTSQYATKASQTHRAHPPRSGQPVRTTTLRYTSQLVQHGSFDSRRQGAPSQRGALGYGLRLHAPDCADRCRPDRPRGFGATRTGSAVGARDPTNPGTRPCGEKVCPGQHSGRTGRFHDDRSARRSALHDRRSAQGHSAIASPQKLARTPSMYWRSEYRFVIRWSGHTR